MLVRRIAVVLLLVLLLAFVVMNRETARVWFFGIRAEMPLAFVALVAGALGAGAGLLYSFVHSRSPAGASKKPPQPPR